jgi:hypothetical protein
VKKSYIAITENDKWKIENEPARPIVLLGEREDESQRALHLHRNSIQHRRLEDPLTRRIHRGAAQQRMTADRCGFNDASLLGNHDLHLH